MFNEVKFCVKELICASLKIPYNRYGISNFLIKYLPKNRAISLVDIGAHNGDFTNAIDKFCGISQGLLIEPLPHKAARLRQLFHLPKYQVFECALSSENDFIDFQFHEIEVTSSILNIHREIPEIANINIGNIQTIKCPTRTLDNVVEEANLEAIDLLKIDVQGAEHLVFSGCNKSMPKISMIWTEVSFKPLYEGSSTFSDIYFLLNKAGFKLMEIQPGFRSPDGEMIQGDALFINTIKG